MSEFICKVYNKDFKERFLTDININQYPPRWWERVFEKVYPFEKQKDKDLFEFTTPEIIEFYKFLDVSSLESLIVYNANLTKYGQWALNNNLINDNQNHFSELDNDVLFSCVNANKLENSVFNLEEFKDIIYSIKNDQDKFVFFCLFEGIKGKNYEDIVNMRLSDIDIKNKTVKLHSGRTVSVSTDFITTAIDANNQKIYENYGNNNLQRNLIPSDKIYKEKSNSNGADTPRTVYNTIVRNFKELGRADFTSNKMIRNSGLIYYLNKRADELQVSVKDLFYDPDKAKDIFEKYNFNLQTRVRFLLIYGQFLK